VAGGGERIFLYGETLSFRVQVAIAKDRLTASVTLETKLSRARGGKPWGPDDKSVMLLRAVAEPGSKATPWHSERRGQSDQQREPSRIAQADYPRPALGGTEKGNDNCRGSRRT